MHSKKSTHFDSKDLSFTVSVNLLWAGFIITAIGCLIMAIMDWTGYQSFELRDYFLLIQLGVIATTLIYHALNVRLNYQVNNQKLLQDRKALALALVGESSSPTVTDSVKILAKLIDNQDKDEGNALHLSDDEEKSLIQLVNFFQKVALTAKYNAADEAILKEHFSHAFRLFERGLKPWIEQKRLKRNDDAIGQAFQEITKQWNQNP